LGLGTRAALLAAGAAVLALAASRPAPAVEGEYEAAVARVPCKLTERISSQDAHSGDRFTFDTTSSVEINQLFLPADTHGHGFVRAAEPARGQHAGTLTLEAVSLDLPDGKQIPVGLEAGQLDRRPARGGRFSAGSGSAAVPAVRESNVVYEAGTAFLVDSPPPPSPVPDAPP
jgi:hypothetical protein